MGFRSSGAGGLGRYENRVKRSGQGSGTGKGGIYEARWRGRGEWKEGVIRAVAVMGAVAGAGSGDGRGRGSGRR